ncbi:MAG: GNAT family N-acetyltransferase [Xanthomonadaceae bacterium]|nr:GNAT family N-acetyltransferase [Xanthomonadaceae bacterium]MDE2225239.1 GNAT family N-acetyltransferase [Xanthomonadaceae bacterium]
MGASAELDRPVWESLASRHASLSEGGALAKRYQRDVNLFASARDDSPAALDALAGLVEPGEHVYVLQVPEIAVPPALRATKTALGVQMVATRSIDAAPAEDIITLGDADAPEMLALAQLTQPGPFLARTHVMGRFRGIRIDGRLAAMAGERMRMPGYTEVSGVCTHPDFRGRGLARRLSAIVATAIQARGETPFLHAWKDNHPAIALYEKLGFRLRAEVNVAVLERAHAR